MVSQTYVDSCNDGALLEDCTLGPGLHELGDVDEFTDVACTKSVVCQFNRTAILGYE